MIKYQNSQMYAECQLVAAINAARYFGLSVPKMGSVEYERLVDLTKGRHGSCIQVWKAYPSLGIKARKTGPAKKLGVTLTWFQEQIPIEIPVHTMALGFHSVLVVRATQKYVWLANFGGDKLVKLGWEEFTDNWFTPQCATWKSFWPRKGVNSPKLANSTVGVLNA